jgi:hypothetical protein
MKLFITLLFLLIAGSAVGLLQYFHFSEAHAGELRHTWKSPSFSGIGVSAHYLTIENQEFTRKAEIESKKKSELSKIETDKKNTNYQKFLTNLESRIYAEFSKQLTDSMFGEACGTTYGEDGSAIAPTAESVEGGGESCTGNVTFNGTAMTFVKDVAKDEVRLTIDGDDGAQTITLPLNDFQF